MSSSHALSTRTEYNEVRYLQDPVGADDSGSLFTAYLTLDWAKTWAAGHAPF